MLSRRAFLAAAFALRASAPKGGLALAVAPPDLRRFALRNPRFQSSPFTLGVASGDPMPDGFVLWTRLAPDPLNGGGMTPERVTVNWRVAEDDGMRNVVRRGAIDASPDYAHAVHVEVSGLRPDRPYWYQFDAGGSESVVGRTRTMPADNVVPQRMRFAFVSCSHFEMGYFTPLGHLADEDVSLAFHLGDYIYESAGRNGGVRRHVGGETRTLDEYRMRYAQYKTDVDLQRVHATMPFAVTWDDHEVDNDYAGVFSEEPMPMDVFLQRRAAAYQAYYEHMPLRASARRARARSICIAGCNTAAWPRSSCSTRGSTGATSRAARARSARARSIRRPPCSGPTRSVGFSRAFASRARGGRSCRSRS